MEKAIFYIFQNLGMHREGRGSKPRGDSRDSDEGAAVLISSTWKNKKKAEI